MKRELLRVLLDIVGLYALIAWNIARRRVVLVRLWIARGRLGLMTMGRW